MFEEAPTDRPKIFDKSKKKYLKLKYFLVESVRASE